MTRQGEKGNARAAREADTDDGAAGGGRSRAGVAAALTALTLSLATMTPLAGAQAASPVATEAPPADATASPAAPAVAEPVPPDPDLGGLEPAVAAQLAGVRETVIAQLAAVASPVERASAWGDLAQVYHAYGLLDAAALCYAEASALTPGDYRWPYLLAHVRRGQGELAAARQSLQASLALVEYPPALVALSEVELTLGRAAEAETAARRALATRPGDAAASAALGQALLARERWSEAAAALEAALAAAPGADRLRYPLGLAYRELGDEAKARDSLAAAGRAGVRSEDPLLDALDASRRGELAPLLRGRRAAGAGDWVAAEREFRQALTANPSSVPARVNLAAVLAALGQREAALAELRTVLAQEPGSFTASFNLGVLLLDAGDATGALAPLADAVRARPGDAEARRSMGEALLALGRVEEALPHLRAAVVAAPVDEAARVDEAVALLRLARLAEARQRLDEAVRELPAAGRPAHLLARLLASSTDLSLRDGARALELASAVWAVRPALEHGRTLAMALAEVGRCEEAARLAERLASEAPAPYDQPLRADAAAYASGPPCRPGLAAGNQ